MAKSSTWFIIVSTLCGISTVFGQCETLDPPQDLTISLFEGKSLLVQWTAPKNQDTCDITYSLRILQNGIAVETIETKLTEHLTVWPGSCTQIDAILYARTTDDVYSGLVITNWYTGAPTEIGIVENRLIDVNETFVVITFEPPVGSPNCRFLYEIVYLLDGDVVHYSTTTELMHAFNYVVEKLLCKVLYMEVTAISGSVRGETYTNIVVTDKFEVDLGEVSDFSLSVSDVLEISWEAPKYYESCPVYYTLRITSVHDGIELLFIEGQFNNWTFDYAIQELYCVGVDIVLTPYMRGQQGIATTEFANFAPPSQFGTVENRCIVVDETSVIITYEPPMHLSMCSFVYEMIYSLDGVVVYSGLTDELIHTFNYVERKLLCKVLYMELTAIIDDVRGLIYDNYVVTDRFDIDLGQASAFSLTVTDVLEISWENPQYYESCPVYYTLRITSARDGQELFFRQDMFNSWIFDPSDQDLHCLEAVVTLTPYMRETEGISTSEAITFGPPPSGTC